MTEPIVLNQRTCRLAMSESILRNLSVEEGEILTSFIFVALFSFSPFFFTNTHTDGSVFHVLMFCESQ